MENNNNNGSFFGVLWVEGGFRYAGMNFSNLKIRSASDETQKSPSAMQAIRSRIGLFLYISAWLFFAGSGKVWRFPDFWRGFLAEGRGGEGRERGEFRGGGGGREKGGRERGQRNGVKK